MEVCTTLGMLSPIQAKQLKEAYVSLLPRRLDDLSADTVCARQRLDGL
jgi:biotin synthase-like enzyme